MKKILCICLTILMVTSVIAFVFPLMTMARDTAFYVDSVGGDDSKDGKSPANAWKTLDKVNDKSYGPGDHILFRRGCAWKGALAPMYGNGSEAKPIIVDAYGDPGLPLPIINGNGIKHPNPKNTNHVELAIDAAVYLRSQSNWVIRNLYVTNPSSQNGNRNGIHIDGNDSVTVSNIIIENCVVENVASDPFAGFHDYKPMAGISVWSRTYGTRFINIKIRNNQIINAKATGLFVNAGGNGPHSYGVHISDNYLQNIGADGMIINKANEALIENNVLNDWCNSRATYHDGIWVFESINSLVQYNEVMNGADAGDGLAYDADYRSTGSTFQYNYSHNNVGFILICVESGWTNKDIHVRYNISRNDRAKIIQFAGYVEDVYIYNNTFYLSGNQSFALVWDHGKGETPTNVKFYNNIIYNTGGNGSIPTTLRNTEWKNNIFYGTFGSLNTITDSSNKKSTDPKFASSKTSAGIGINSLPEFALASDSPALGAGAAIPSVMIGKWPITHDYYGHPVSSGSAAPNIGAWNGKTGDAAYNPANTERVKVEYTYEPYTYQGTEPSVPFTGTNTTTIEFVLGDINGDSAVDVEDLLLLKKHVLKIAEFGNESREFKAADVNKDGTVDVEDLLLVKKYVLKLIDKF